MKIDNTSERVVQDALEKAKEGRTTIIIAHRLSTIRNADIIIGLEHGEVVECGSHTDLMQRKGLYYELVTAQTQKDNKDEESDSESEDEDDEKMDKLVVPVVPGNEVGLFDQVISFILIDRRVSRMSIFSIGSDLFDDDANETTLANLVTKKRWLRTPFLYKISKLNMPEWRWILLGTLISLLYGSTNPLYGLIFSNLYSAFGEPDVHKQESATRTYAGIGFCIGIASGLAQFLTSYSFAKSGEALTMRMRKLTFSAMLRQEMSYFDQEANSTGALVTRLSSDASALKVIMNIHLTDQHSVHF